MSVINDVSQEFISPPELHASCFYQDLRKWADRVALDDAFGGCVDYSDGKFLPCNSPQQSCAGRVPVGSSSRSQSVFAIVLLAGTWFVCGFSASEP
mmetsp:Transcript_5726/g.6727  ORF Transcript_5726/g.6727 Transcript_5726/m.6727 type:complete len:96 (+) Transcript_5726:327-614(+)